MTISSLKKKNNMIKDQNEVAETLNEHFANNAKDLSTGAHKHFTDHSHVVNIPGDLVTKRDQIQRTNHHKVKEILNAIKPNKAIGYDTIPSRAVRASRESIAEPLSKLINTVCNGSENTYISWKKEEIEQHYKQDSVSI